MADATLHALRRSPLHDLVTELGDGATVSLVERPYLSMVSVRVDPASDAARSIETVLGAPLPRRVGATAQHGAHTALWLGPDEWLVISDDDADELTEHLRVAAGDAPSQIVNVSSNRTLIDVSGPDARGVLEKGCPADLHPRACSDGTAIVTSLARVPVLLWKVSAGHFRVLPRASLAQYIALWLLDAAREFAPNHLVPEQRV